MVEAEQDPAKANPFKYAKMAYEYITGLSKKQNHIMLDENWIPANAGIQISGLINKYRQGEKRSWQI